ncbi:MAG: integrase/recombinase XerD, partial [Acidimicrobiaceae bacterium]|nr:integrase/recombinase XerD [Acidimicrobiaceae bacterium]
MGFKPCLVRSVVGGQVSFELGHSLLDDYLRFVSARARPNTLRATAHDLKTFFCFVGKPPAVVSVSDVVAFISAQRLGDGDRTVVGMDGSSGVSARTIRRRLSSVS